LVEPLVLVHGDLDLEAEGAQGAPEDLAEARIRVDQEGTPGRHGVAFLRRPPTVEKRSGGRNARRPARRRLDLARTATRACGGWPRSAAAPVAPTGDRWAGRIDTSRRPSAAPSLPPLRARSASLPSFLPRRTAPRRAPLLAAIGGFLPSPPRASARSPRATSWRGSPASSPRRRRGRPRSPKRAAAERPRCDCPGSRAAPAGSRSP